jgi:hypothetical protein
MTALDKEVLFFAKALGPRPAVSFFIGAAGRPT